MVLEKIGPVAYVFERKKENETPMYIIDNPTPESKEKSIVLLIFGQIGVGSKDRKLYRLAKKNGSVIVRMKCFGGAPPLRINLPDVENYIIEKYKLTYDGPEWRIVGKDINIFGL